MSNSFKEIKDASLKSSQFNSSLKYVTEGEIGLAPSHDYMDNLNHHWHHILSIVTREFSKFYPPIDTDNLRDCLTYVTGMPCVHCYIDLNETIYPQKLTSIVGTKCFTLHYITGSRAFIFDGARWKKTGSALGKLYSYGENPLTYLDFKALPYEKAGNFEQNIVYYGVELEVNPINADKINAVAKLVHTDLTTDFAMLKLDSSIGNGFEIVTAPATLAYHRGTGEYKGAWDKFFDDSAKLCCSWTTDRCGMHVHISKNAFLSPTHLGKMSAFYHSAGNKEFIIRVAGRDSDYGKFNTKHNPFTSKILKTDTTAPSIPLNAVFKSGKSYERGAVNLHKKDTIEIRIFKGNTSKVGFFKNLEFVDSVFEYSKILRYNPLSEAEKLMHKRRLKAGSTGQEMEIYGIVYTDYLKWLENNKSSNYSNLKLWLYKNDLLKSGGIKKVTSKTPKNKIIEDSQINAVA